MSNETIVAERARIAAILESDEGRAHPKQALKLALHTDMSAEMAVDILGDAPSETARDFDRRMSAEGHTGVNSPLGSNPAPDAKERRRAEIAAAAGNVNRANGFKSEAKAGNRFAVR